MNPGKMNSMRQRRRSRFCVIFALAVLAGSLVNSLRAWDYGNGRHGSFVLTTNSTIEQLYQTVRLTNDPAQYNPADSNAIPNFQTLIITNGATLTANAWNGSAGGVISLKVQASLSIAAGAAISVNGIGYRGGGTAYPGQYAAGVQGESYAGSPTASGNANHGGGGGSFVWSVSNGHPNYTGPGAGGGYGGTGAAVGNSFCSCGPTGGGTYGTPSIDTVYLGSGGGGSADSGYPNGGNGGGAIVIICGSINLVGQIHADGNAGGGGGSGGSIKLLVAEANVGTNHITAAGGTGTASGGVGRIAVTAIP